MPDNNNSELVITVIETDTNSATVIASHPSIRHHKQVGVIAFCASLDSALRIAYENLLVWEVAGAVKTISLELNSDTVTRRRSSIALSDKALSTLMTFSNKYGFNITIKGQGLFAFLAALIQLNSNPENDWLDTRDRHPEQLQLDDVSRLREGKLPLWSQAPDVAIRIRKPRGIIGDNWKPLIPAYAALGRHYGIAPYRGGSFENPSVVASATVEAIGLEYLTPRAWPTSTYTRTRESMSGAKSRKGRLAFERFSF